MLQNTPLVSVLMPAFNAENYIAESIQSVIDQTLLNWELIVLDDGSTDNTQNIVKKIINKYESNSSEIRLLSHPYNQGLISTRNDLLTAANGNYIAWLDADDLYDPQKLQKQIHQFKNNQHIDICATEYFTLDMSNNRLKKRKCYSRDADLKALLTVYNPICNSSTMIKSDVAKRFPFLEDKNYAEDYDVWCRMASNGFHFFTIKEPMLIYRIHDKQVSLDKQAEMHDIFLKSQLEYLYSLGIEKIPPKIPFFQRLKDARAWLLTLNRTIHIKSSERVSFLANTEIYARFQYRKNGIFTIITRTERWLISFYTSFFS